MWIFVVCAGIVVTKDVVWSGVVNKLVLDRMWNRPAVVVGFNGAFDLLERVPEVVVLGGIVQVE